jgi:hypothetical protein
MAESWQDFFQPGESLLWEGAPKRGIHGIAKIIGLGIFGIPFLAAGLGMLATGLGMAIAGGNLGSVGLGLFLTIFALPFAGVGAALVFGQAYAAHQAHRRVRYAVSTRAAFIAENWWSRKIDCYPILRSSAIGLEKGRWADTVWFHVRAEKDSDGDLTTTRISFENIADGEKVFSLLRGIQTGAHP